MPEPGDRPRPSLGQPALLVIAVVVFLVATLAAVLLATRDDGNGGNARGDTAAGIVTIKSFDDVTLSASVTRPAGSGTHPLVIMPSSYNANASQYATLATLLTRAGYVTVSYTQRGFYNSGGSVDLAGPNTQRDARSVIDWSLQHTAADPKRIGMLGVSYGAGISLLTAAHDPRVRAVVALSTWTDFAEAFHPNDTLSVYGLGGLLSYSRADSDMRTLLNQLRTNPVGDAGKFVSYAKPRSPATFVSGLNRNKTAVMIANGWQDSLFPPTMLVDFFGKLTTPKRLQLSVGDHVGPERALLSGRRSKLGDAALAWLAHFLDGAANGIDKQRPVALEDVTTKTVRNYSSWPGTGGQALALASPSASGTSITTSASTWQADLTTGQDTDAKAPAAQFVAGEDYKIPTTRPESLPGDRALVWRADAASQAAHIVGTPRLSLSVASSAPVAAIFVYLYDTAPDGTGSLMTLTPFTFSSAGGAAKPVSVDLEPIDWTLPAGHRLDVVIDTAEPRWLQAAPAGTRVTVSSTESGPAGLRLPVR